MALVLKDRVKETTTTTGTGTVTLNGAAAGFQSFSVIGNANTTYYTIVDSVNGTWEVGIGTYTSSGTTLSRDTILESSNGGSAVNFAAGTKDVFVTYPAERSTYVDGSSIVPATAATLPVISGGTGQSSYTNGQLLIGNTTGNTLDKATLTAGTGISVTNGAGSISIAATNNGTVTSVATNDGITGGPITSTGTVGLTGQALALHNLSTNGLFARTGAGTVAARTVTASTGISVTNGDGVSGNPTITNTAPDQTVVLTAGTGITTSGTYPNFTIANAGVTSFSAGTTGLTPSTGTTGAVTLNGTLNVANGGTGQTTYTNGQLLIGNTTGNTLTKATLTAGTGISITNGAGSISIAATNNGTVTAVTGTSPVASSGGTTPAISLSTGYGDTQNPYASKTQNTFLAAPNGTAGVPTFRAIVAADVPTLNQNTTGTAANVTGTVAVANGGTGATTAPNARTNLGATTVGANFFTLTNPSAIRFPRINADNTVSSLSDSDFRTAIGAGTGNGTVTSVGGTGTVNGISLSGTVTSSGNLTLGGTLSGVDLTSQVTGTLPVANGGTGITSLGTGVATFLGTPSSANLASAVTDETGSGSLVFGTSPSLTTPTLSKAVLNDGYTEEVFAITDGATVNLDPNNGSIQTWTLGASRTPGQANWSAGQSITLMIDDGSAYSITWSTLNVVWETNGGIAPTLATSGFTVIVLWKVSTTIYGARVGDA